MAGPAGQVGLYSRRKGRDVSDMEHPQGIEATEAAAHQVPVVCQNPQVHATLVSRTQALLFQPQAKAHQAGSGKNLQKVLRVIPP